MGREIELSTHDPAWRAEFDTEAALLVEVFGQEVVAVHHIGSTAIPGILAKSIIDILLEVRDIEAVDAFNEAMAEIGYQSMGEYGIPGRRYFRRLDGDRHTHHIHTFQTAHPEVGRHIRFRNYLNSHPDDAAAYSRLKEELRARFPTDVVGYTDGKSEFIAGIDRRAREAE
jgi:GrpB-like predicted nucleotidyltransferase (UPF0157 family)